MLSLDAVTVRFGGLTAVNAVSLDVADAGILGLVGPNGAGKTTLFNAISGLVTPKSGAIRFAGLDISRWPQHRRARAGLGRTFQIPQPLAQLTVRENLIVAQRFGAGGVDAAKLDEILALVNLTGKAGDDAATALSLSELKALEVAKALATDPQLLLLDEVLAGLESAGKRAFRDMLQKVHERFRVGLLIIEHDIETISALCPRVVVLNFGEVIADGAPGEVFREARVVESYCGAGWHMSMLEVKNLRAGYGAINILWDLSLDIEAGRVTTIIGPNGAGKTTLLRAIMGILPATAGEIRLDGELLAGTRTWSLIDLGLAMIPEGRMVFRDMSVEENLLMGAFPKARRAAAAENLERGYQLFPKLRERRRQLAGLLSGGEAQMLAMARGLMSAPRVLLIDEPSLGLAPVVVQEIFAIIDALKAEGKTIVLVEQNTRLAVKAADHVYLMQSGKVALSQPARDVDLDRLHDLYFARQ